jgi:uncharacterized Fe-S cluster-containing protein
MGFGKVDDTYLTTKVTHIVNSTFTSTIGLERAFREEKMEVKEAVKIAKEHFCNINGFLNPSNSRGSFLFMGILVGMTLK